MTIPLLQSLDPGATELHFFTKEQFKEILELFLPSARIHTISGKAPLSELNLKIDELKAVGFDVVVDLHRNLRSLILCAHFMLHSRCVRIRKFRLKEFFFFLFKDGGARFFGVRPIDRRAEMRHVLEKAAVPFLKTEWVDAVGPKNIVSGKENLVCIAVDSAWGTKEWSLQKFKEVAEEIARSAEVVFLGRRHYAELDDMGPSIKNLTGKTNYRDLFALLARARLLLCNDAGLMHFAENLNTPVISVFGPTTASLGFAPRLSQSRIVESSLWCRPCSKSGKWCHRATDKQLCLKQVDAVSVLSEVKSVMKRNGLHGNEL